MRIKFVVGAPTAADSFLVSAVLQLGMGDGNWRGNQYQARVSSHATVQCDELCMHTIVRFFQGDLPVVLLGRSFQRVLPE